MTTHPYIPVPRREKLIAAILQHQRAQGRKQIDDHFDIHSGVRFTALNGWQQITFYIRKFLLSIAPTPDPYWDL
jgi:hypothetical protein